VRAAVLGLVVSLLPAAGATAQPDPAAARPCTACRADPEAVRADYDPEAWRALATGEILTREHELPADQSGVRKAVEAVAIFDAPPECVWAVVTDHVAFPRFLPNVKETRVRRRDEDRVFISQHLRVMLVNVRYGSIWTLRPEQGVAAWTLDPETENDIRRSDGSWQLVPFEGGVKTLARYRTDVDTGRSLPETVERMLTRHSLPKVMRGVREELARRSERTPPC
jgi:ribosome-associated toxin RatA of RatAB toxin-antitoxin module